MCITKKTIGPTHITEMHVHQIYYTTTISTEIQGRCTSLYELNCKYNFISTNFISISINISIKRIFKISVKESNTMKLK